MATTALLALACLQTPVTPLAGPPLAGTVRDAARGDGVPNVEVTYHVWSAPANVGRGPEHVLAQDTAATDGSGRFGWPQVQRGPITLSLYDPATERSLGRHSGNHPSANEWTCEADLGPTLPLVIEHGGEFRASDWRVRIVEDGPGGDVRVWPWRALSEGDPAWARWPFVEYPPDGAWRARLEVQGRDLHWVGSAPLPRTTGAPADAVVVVCEPRSTLCGKLVHHADTAVVGVETTAGEWLETTVGAEGQFAFRGLRGGPHRVVARRPGRPPAVRMVAVGADDLELEPWDLAPPAERAELTVRLDRADAAAPACVLVRRAETPDGWPIAWASVGVLPGAGTSVRLSALPHGTYRVAVDDASGRRWAPQEVTLPAQAAVALAPVGEPHGDVEPLRAILEDGAPTLPRRLRLHVRNADGAYDPGDWGAYVHSRFHREPIADAEVVVAGRAVGRTDAEGALVLEAWDGELVQIRQPGAHVFPSPGFRAGRPRGTTSDVVVWMHSTPPGEPSAEAGGR